MLKLLDRMILRNFVQAYVICFVCLMSLYVVIDLFNYLDDFIEKSNGWANMFVRMGEYYGYRIVLIGDKMSSAIIFLAAMFTLAWMQRNNEILPVLAAG